jgi:hypothetical protein
VVTQPVIDLELSQEREALKAAGVALFDAVFAGTVLRLYAESLVRSHDAAVRIRVWPAGELAAYAWELLHDGRDFLCLSTHTPVSRGMDAADVIPAPAVPPMKVLLTLSTPGNVPIEAAQERTAIENVLAPLISLGRLQLDVASDGTLSSIRRLLRSAAELGRPYHVWHFIGHGLSSDPFGGTGLLVESSEGWPRVVDAALLRTLFHDHPELRLVVLNACHAGRVVTDDAAAAAFIGSGVGAVVAMQLEISPDIAGTFAEELYGALVDGAEIDDAVTEARRAIYLQRDLSEWMTPVVFVRGSSFAVY